MSTQGPVINEEGLRVLGRNVSRITQGILLTVGVVSTVFTLAGEYSHGEHYLQSWLVDNVAIMGALLHLVLVILILFPGRLRKMNSDVKDPTVRAVIRCLNHFFIPAWTWIWVFFGLLYVVLLFRTLSPELGHGVRMDHTPYQTLVRERALMDAFNVGSTLFIVLIYHFLTPSFLRRYVRRTRRIVEMSWWYRAKRWMYRLSAKLLREAGAILRWAQWPLGSGGVWRLQNRFMAKMYGAKPLAVAGHERTNAWVGGATFYWFLGISIVLCSALCYLRLRLLDLEDPGSWEQRIELMLGSTSALALAAFAGRIDSQFIRNWQWVIPFLFLYAAIQSYTSALYQDVQISRAVFTYAAFTLKCLLFIFVSNFFEDRKAIYYAYENVDVADKRSI